MRSVNFLAFASAFVGVVTLAAQPADSIGFEQLLTSRLSLAAADLARVNAGEAVAWKLAGNAPNEVGAAGAIRAPGDLRRMVIWLRDIEAFMRASGTENVGALHAPVLAADFVRLNLDDAEFGDIKKCKPGKCEMRMPASYLARFQNEITWSAPDASVQAAALTKRMLTEYVTAYQTGGDAATGALHDPGHPDQLANGFRDMLRGATKAWDLAPVLASYLETFPKGRPETAEDHFYWTRDKLMGNRMLTLHHVVLQELPDGRVLLADKQFYASREVEETLMMALLIPTADGKGFDVVVAVRARLESAGGKKGKLLKGRIEKEITSGLRTYLNWIRDSAAL